MNRARLTLLILLLLSLPLGGCAEDIIRALVPVNTTDGEVWAPDGLGVDADLAPGTSFAVTGIKPNHGPFTGGTETYITGLGFNKSAAVKIGGVSVDPTKIVLVSPQALKIVTPAGKPGTADVTVTLSKGGSSATLKAGYTYDSILLDPSSGPVAGGTLVTVQASGLAFSSATTLKLGGLAMTDVTVVSASVLKAVTPKTDRTGPAHLELSEGGTTTTVREAFTYYQASNPRNGGLGGGPLKGTLTVSVLNTYNRSPITGAKVVAQKERTLTLSAVTDGTGTAVLTNSKLSGKVSVTAGAKGFESASILAFDARDVTIFLTPLPRPQPGPLPPGQSPGVIKGSIMFGGATGVGSTKWKLVPEPKSKNQVKRAYVYTSVPSMAWGAPSLGTGTYVDYTSDGSTAWEYTMYGRSGSMAVYAIAGIYNKTSGSFQPYVMGITRGVVVGPGDVVFANIKMNIPLTERVKVRIKDAPVDLPRYRVRLAIDVGADGLVMRPDSELKGDGVPDQLAYGRLPAFNHQGLIDATYTAEVRISNNQTKSELPFTVATVKMTLPKGGEIVADQFLGVPRQIKPGPGGKIQGNTLAWAYTGGKASLSVVILRKTDQTPVWRFYAPGDVTIAKLPDPATLGLPAWPSGPLVWVQYLARLPGFKFDNFTYSHLSTRYWDRYSYDIFSVAGP